jgi:hypothetical protein
MIANLLLRGQVFMEHLDGHLTRLIQPLSQVDLAHAALAQQAKYFVAFLENLA